MSKISIGKLMFMVVMIMLDLFVVWCHREYHDLDDIMRDAWPGLFYILSWLSIIVTIVVPIVFFWNKDFTYLQKKGIGGVLADFFGNWDTTY